jgi:hypothetical protein
VVLQQAETQVPYAASSQTDAEANLNQTVESNPVPETKEIIEEGIYFKDSHLLTYPIYI